jgi:hypothetical protein
MMGPLLIALIAALKIDLADPSDCVARSELERELSVSLSSSDLASLEIRVRVLDVGSGALELSWSIARDDQTLLERTSRLARADCADAPRLIARIVRRYLEEHSPMETARPPPEPMRAPQPVRPSPPTQVETPWRLSPSIGVGPVLGLGPGANPWLEAAIDLAIGKSSGWVIDVGLGGAIDWPQPVGTGKAQVVDAFLAGGGGYLADLGGASLRLTARGLIGTRAAEGKDFSRPSSVTRPYAGAEVGATLRLESPLFFRAAATLPFTNLELVDAGSGASWSTPGLMLGLLIGVEGEILLQKEAGRP